MYTKQLRLQPEASNNFSPTYRAFVLYMERDPVLRELQVVCYKDEGGEVTIVYKWCICSSQPDDEIFDMCMPKTHGQSVDALGPGPGPRPGAGSKDNIIYRSQHVQTFDTVWNVMSYLLIGM